jgi:hypothetical protein
MEKCVRSFSLAEKYKRRRYSFQFLFLNFLIKWCSSQNQETFFGFFFCSYFNVCLPGCGALGYGSLSWLISLFGVCSVGVFLFYIRPWCSILFRQLLAFFGPVLFSLFKQAYMPLGVYFVLLCLAYRRGKKEKEGMLCVAIIFCLD